MQGYIGMFIYYIALYKQLPNWGPTTALGELECVSR